MDKAFTQGQTKIHTRMHVKVFVYCGVNLVHIANVVTPAYMVHLQSCLCTQVYNYLYIRGGDS